MRAPMGRGRPGPYDVPYDRFSRYGGGFGGYEEDVLDYDVSTKVYMRGLCLFFIPFFFWFSQFKKLSDF